MKDDPKSNLIYVLADYKQLVLQYKTKFSQQMEEAMFWKTTAIWCMFIIFCMCAVMYFLVTDVRRSFADSKNSIGQLNSRLAQITVKQDKTQQELVAAKDELKLKGEAISRLEQGISSASKRLVENLLRGQQ
jgi:hypothetical protein